MPEWRQHTTERPVAVPVPKFRTAAGCGPTLLRSPTNARLQRAVCGPATCRLHPSRAGQDRGAEPPSRRGCPPVRPSTLGEGARQRGPPRGGGGPVCGPDTRLRLLQGAWRVRGVSGAERLPPCGAGCLTRLYAGGGCDPAVEAAARGEGPLRGGHSRTDHLRRPWPRGAGRLSRALRRPRVRRGLPGGQGQVRGCCRRWPGAHGRRVLPLAYAQRMWLRPLTRVALPGRSTMSSP